MEYVRLGNSGLKVSKVILSHRLTGSHLGMEHIKAAYDLGINAFDTADVYANGRSEIVLGKAIKKYNLPRDEIVVMTKCFQPVPHDIDHKGWLIATPQNLDAMRYTNQYGSSRKDDPTVHRFDPTTPVEETMEALHDVVKAGYARYIGISSCYAWQFHKMQAYAREHGLTQFISMQNYHNAIYREEEREMAPLLQDLGVGMIPWSPLARGFLTRPIDIETTRANSDIFFGMNNADPTKDGPSIEINRRVSEIAKRHGVSMAQVALAWSLSKPFMTAPIVGTTSLEKLRDIVGGVKIKLTEEEVKSIDEPYRPKPVIGHLGRDIALNICVSVFRLSGSMVEFKTPNLARMSSRSSSEPSGTSTPPHFLDTVEGEIALFRGITQARPVGLHRHFHVLAILQSIKQETGQHVTADDVWTKLRTLYDLGALEELEDQEEDPLHEEEEPPKDSVNYHRHPHFRTEFQLPQTQQFEEIIAPRRAATESTPASPEPPTPSTAQHARKPSNSTSTPAKAMFDSEGELTEEEDEGRERKRSRSVKTDSITAGTTGEGGADEDGDVDMTAGTEEEVAASPVSLTLWANTRVDTCYRSGGNTCGYAFARKNHVYRDPQRGPEGTKTNQPGQQRRYTVRIDADNTKGKFLNSVNWTFLMRTTGTNRNDTSTKTHNT
ncbi:hypothetical protein FRC01_003874 [Tulasnella sp. 417]|nr:hypothetical protein FRC01_003874 [Tulasnella sp. 417]